MGTDWNLIQMDTDPVSLTKHVGAIFSRVAFQFFDRFELQNTNKTRYDSSSAYALLQ